jgi:hypothetical protein
MKPGRPVNKTQSTSSMKTIIAPTPIVVAILSNNTGLLLSSRILCLKLTLKTNLPSLCFLERSMV